METLKISKQDAIRHYKDAPEWMKTIFDNTFGEKTFKNEITDRIKTFKDACKELGIDSDKINTTGSVDEFAYRKLKIIVAALNEGWTPDWNNSEEYKYFPWFRLSGGSGFSSDSYDCTCSRSTVGSRLCFKSAELAKYAGTQFAGIYKDFITL